MNSEQELYYKSKNEERRRMKEKESNTELLQYIIFGSQLALAVFSAFIVISPGVLSVTAVAYYFSFKPDLFTAWLTGLAISLFIAGGIYLYTNNPKKTALLYALIAFLSFITIYYLPLSDNQTAFKKSLNLYLPILSTKSTETAKLSKDVSNESEDANPPEKSSEQKKPAVVPIQLSTEARELHATPVEIEPNDLPAQFTELDQKMTVSDDKPKENPSFDCSLASHQFEILVCENPQLSALDSQLSLLYTSVRKQLSPEDKNTLLKQQREWIKQSRLCNSITCITNAYEMRMEQISSFQSR